MMTTLFDPRTHTYWRGGRRLPSVTEILRWSGEVPEDAWHSPASVAALARGRRVHRACEALCRGRAWDHLALPAERGYVEAWRRLRQALAAAFTHVEATVSHPCGFAGTVDRAGYLAGRAVVLDLKTGDPRPWHALQLALYDLALRAEAPIPRTRVCAYLAADGRYTLKVHKHPGDEARALALVRDWSDAHADDEEEAPDGADDLAALADD